MRHAEQEHLPPARQQHRKEGPAAHVHLGHHLLLVPQLPPRRLDLGLERRVAIRQRRILRLQLGHLLRLAPPRLARRQPVLEAPARQEKKA